MREIKFRAWDKLSKVMRDCPPFAFGTAMMHPDDFIVMQFTGIKDKSGREVYEGDVCRFYPYPEDPGFFHGLAVMTDETVGGRWRIFRCDNEVGEEFLDSTAMWNDDYEVVGNIYENPELLNLPDKIQS